MKLDPRILTAWKMNRALPVGLACLIVLTLSLSLLISYQLSPGLNELERRYLDLEKKSRQAEQVKLATDTPAAIYRKGRADLDKFFELIPEKSALTSVIKDVFEMSQKAGLDITQVGYGNKLVKDQNLLEYKLNFSVSGTYTQLKRFVFLLERAERLLAIESLALNSSSGEPGKIGLQLSLATYFRAPAETL